MTATPPPRLSSAMTAIPFADWPPVPEDWRETRRRQLARLVSPDRLQRLRTCILEKEPAAQGEFEDAVDFSEPPAVDLTDAADAAALTALRDRGRQIAPHTAFVIAAAGAGTRLARSVPAEERQRLIRTGRMTKPTFPVGPVSGASPLCRTLEALSRLRLQEGIDHFPVWVVVSTDTRAAVEQDLERNERRVSLPDLTLLNQSENPTFDLEGRLLVTWDPGADSPRLVTSAGGTFGVLRTLQEPQPGLKPGTRMTTPLAVAEAERVSRFVVLYGDEALLTDADRILELLGVSETADLVLVGVEKDALRIPPGGTLHSRRVGDGPPRLCITELAARTTALDERELTWHAETGRYFPLNAGPLVLRTKVLQLALSRWNPPVHVARRELTLRAGPEPDAETRTVVAAKPEEFLPEIVHFANDQGLRCQVATCDRRHYGAIKDYAAAMRVSHCLASASRQWLARRQVPVPHGAKAEVSTGSRVTVAEPVRVIGDVSVEIDGETEFGREVVFTGGGYIRLLGRVSVGDRVQLDAAGVIVILSEGPAPLSIGEGVRLRCPHHSDLRSALLVLDSIPPETVLDPERLAPGVDTLSDELAARCRRVLWEWSGEPLFVTCWVKGKATRTLVAPGTTVVEALRSLPTDRRLRTLWQLHKEAPSAFESLEQQIDRETDRQVSAALATAKLLDETQTDLDLALLELTCQLDDVVCASPQVLAAALTGHTHPATDTAAVQALLSDLRTGRQAPATPLAEMVAAVGSDRYRNLVARFDGPLPAKHARLVKCARRLSRSTVDFLRQPFLPPDQVDAEALRRLLGSDQMTRSFSGVRAVYGEQPTLSFSHRLIAAADAYAFVELLTRESRRGLKIVLAHDPRPTSAALLDAHVRGLLAAGRALQVGIHPLNLGLLATPVFEEAVRELRADGGIMITASHCPLEQNGSKYAGGVADANGHPNPLAGALLPPADMDWLTRRAEQLIEQVRSGNRDLLQRLNDVDERAVAEALEPHSLCREESWQAFVRLLCRQLALTDDRALAEFRKVAGRTKLVLDPNGGSGCERGAVLLRGFGFPVHQVNTELGRPMHDIEPGEKAFEDLIPAMRTWNATVGGVLDWDADRLVWAARDRYGGVSAARSQQVAAFNVALWLSWLHLRGALESKRVAVVAHGPTSTAVDDIAAVFGAQVFRVETGEMNLVTRMTRLREEGWLAAVGVEGANGGTLFGEDTCRNGFLTLLVAGMVAANAELVCHWLRLSGRWDQLDEAEQKRFAQGKYTLDEVIDSLPRYHTSAVCVTATRTPPRPGWQGLLKDRFFQRFMADYWNHPDRRSRCGLGPPDRDYVSCRQTNYEEAGEVEHRTGDQSGGYKIELTDNRGDRSFVWLRFSRTEPSKCRLIVDSRHEAETRALSRAAVDLFHAALGDLLAAP